MKPFDLEKALAGEPVVTRDGREVTKLHLFDCKGYSHPLMGVCDELILSWTKDGAYFEDEGDHRNDLFMKSKTVVKWVNIYDDGRASAWDSQKEADKWQDEITKRLGNKAHRIEWEE